MSVKCTFIITWEKNNENKGDAVNFLLDSQMILRCGFFKDFNWTFIINVIIAKTDIFRICTILLK